MINDKKHEIIQFLTVLAMALFLAISFYVVMGVNSDDSATYGVAHRRYDLGTEHLTVGELIKPWNLTVAIVYKLYAGNTGADMVACCFAIWYFFMVLIMLSIISENIKHRWLMLLAVFIMMPWTLTNEFHYESTFTALFVLWGVNKYRLTKHRIPLIVSVIFAVYMLIAVSDKVLLLMDIMAPAGIYVIVWCWQKKEQRKYLYVGFIIVAFGMACAKIISDMCGHSILNQFQGYGGADYMYWTDSYTFFTLGIPSFFSALLDQYNIPLNGGFIQFSSFYWIIRIVIVGAMFVVFVLRCKDIVRKRIENIFIVDSLAIFASVSLVSVNVLNGILKGYGQSLDVPINRYAALVWFLLPIIFIRFLDEHYESFEVMTIKNGKITSGMIYGLICCILIAGYSQPLYKGRAGLAMEPCQSEVDFLEGQGDIYQCGLGAYWKSYPISAVTNGAYKVCVGNIVEDEADHDILYLISTDEGDYKDGDNYFNFLITREYNPVTMSDENIETIRGDYIAKHDIYSDYNKRVGRQYFFGGGNSTFYLYDYDIRFDPRLIMEAVGTDYELTDAIQYYFDFPVGTNRIEMDVANSANFQLSINDNEDVDKVDVQIINDKKIYVDLVCTQNTEVTFNVARKTDELTTIHKIVLKRVRAAIKVDSDEIFLKAGSYIVSFNGSGLHNAQVSFEGDGITARRLTDGNIKNRYQIDIDKAQIVKCEVAGKKVMVDSVYYENTDLFEYEQWAKK